ncbi:MAG: Ca-activated chloride channel [Verrucomicrobiota bacterium]|jgi:Ca-activated chloride channel family protein
MKFTFAHPWFLLLVLALPAVAWWRARRGKPPAFLYSSVELARGVANVSRSAASRVLSALRWMALALFIAGLARPQFVESETSIKASGVDIVVAVDLSGSMESEDFKLNGRQVNRLVIAKDTLKKFIDRRPGDRIGVVAFAGKAYIASPLTLDHDFLQMNVDRLQLHQIEEGTAIGSGLVAAVNRLRDLKSKSKIVILMTDGQNNVPKVPPLTAAEVAQSLKVKVYTIGVGTHGTAPIPQVDPFGRKYYAQMQVDIDEPTLKEIAAKTGGKYYRADSTDTLRQIYDDIDKLEKTEVEVRRFVQIKELFHWALLPGFCFLLLEVLLGHTVWRRLP